MRQLHGVALRAENRICQAYDNEGVRGGARVVAHLRGVILDKFAVPRDGRQIDQRPVESVQDLKSKASLKRAG